jgi:hypothetical protein
VWQAETRRKGGDQIWNSCRKCRHCCLGQRPESWP